MVEQSGTQTITSTSDQQKSVPVVTVESFYNSHAEKLQMKLEGPRVGFHRKIREPTINRPGLALSGFYTYFAEKRVQVLGAAEHSYLKSLPKRTRIQRIRDLCACKIPCLVMSRGFHLAPELLAVTEAAKVAVFRTPMITMKFINAATIALEVDFSPTVTEFGSMVDILGIGVLIRGASGIGKSETALGLIERGYSLVADDVTRITSLEGRELMATAPDLTRNHMEVRGIGIINVASVFGIGSIRIEKRLDLVVTLMDWQEIDKEILIVNRFGLHARPAAMFVSIASRYRSEIWVSKEGEEVNGKSIMGLMMLAAGQGSKLHIRCEGPDADKAMEELEELINARFNED